MALSQQDHDELVAAARDAAAARGAAESIAATIGALRAETALLREEVAALRKLAPTFVLDVDSDIGACYLTDGIDKRWIRSGEKLNHLMRRLPESARVLERWSGDDIGDVHLVGPEPFVEPPA